MAWLETLVWPEEEDRRERLRHGPSGRRGRPAPAGRAATCSTELPALVEEASAHGTVVVFHSAVAAYLARRGTGSASRS